MLNKIGFLIIATGKYTQFVDPLVQSIEQFVLPGYEKFYNVFTDQPAWNDKYNFIQTPHETWPGPTLHRFRNFINNWDIIIGDQLIYVDADTRFVNTAGEEILGKCVPVQHCGFIASRGSYETRLESMCYMSPSDGERYYGGGFYSLARDYAEFAFTECKYYIDIDEANGIIPVWHDESAWNKFLWINKPERCLTPSYHYPENHPHIQGIWSNAGVKFDPILLLLDKNHNEIRQ